jgi:hypothetical protein
MYVLGRMIDLPNVTGMLHICCKCTMCIHRWLTRDPSATSPAFQAPAFQVGIDRPFYCTSHELVVAAGCHQLVRPAGTGLCATCLWCYNQSDDGETNANHYNQQDERQQTMMISNETFKNNNKLQYAGKWVHPHSKKRLLAHTKPFRTLFDISRYKQLYWQQQRIFQQYEQ